MNRKYLLASLLMFLSASAFSESKMDSRTVLFSKLQSALSESGQMPDSLRNARMNVKAMMPGERNQQLTEVLLTLSREMTENELTEIGVADPVVVGTVAVGSIDMADLSRIEENASIISVSLSGKGRLHCDLARKDAGVDMVREGGMELPHGFDGSGVIVSIMDQGIEPGHINFLTADRTESRVKRIWHYETTQNNYGGTSTKETAYYTPEEIKDFVTDDDMQTHGTHTLGIMTGSFGVNKEDPEHDYSGMAPGADILIGCGNLGYSNVIRAIKRFSEYAEAEGKPLVVNLSFGDNIGPHDGSDAFPKALDKLAETIPVFMSGGNEANTKIALNKTFSNDDKEIKTVITPRSTIRTYLGVSWEAACEVQIWSEDDTPFTVQTGLWDKSEEDWVFLLPLAPDGEASYIANGQYESISNYQNDEFDYLYQESAIGISTGLDPNNRRYTADIWYMLDKRTNHIDRNIVPVLIVTGQPGKRVDVYCDGEYNEFDSGKIAGWDKGTSDGTISNIACGENTIAVGSYCTRSLSESAKEGEVSNFSSWGILPDGRVLPDVLAPGECLASSMSTPFTASDYYSEQTNPAVYGIMYGEDNPFYWTVMSGTSQASPAMAGIAALWLQANPNLTPADIRQIAQETARPTSEMTPQCGAGKVDALEGLKKAISYGGNSVGMAVAGATPFIISAEKGMLTVDNIISQPFSVEIYDIAGRLAFRLCSADGAPVSFGGSDALPKGIYMIKATSATDSLTRKIML